MPGIAPRLPLANDAQDGLALIRTYENLVRQNLKHLILTNPGERIMDPLFGVGIKQFLFEPNDTIVWSNITAKIHKQVQKYMPYLEIIDISLMEPGSQNSEFGVSNYLPISIEYTIIPLGMEDVLDFTVVDFAVL